MIFISALITEGTAGFGSILILSATVELFADFADFENMAWLLLMVDQVSLFAARR
jgi:hypothetical protein